jgi:hypothetical protein
LSPSVDDCVNHLFVSHSVSLRTQANSSRYSVDYLKAYNSRYVASVSNLQRSCSQKTLPHKNKAAGP